jgi:hypothetical protein
MISDDIIDEFLSKLKKEKIEYFIFLAKKPNKKQQAKNPDIDINIAHYQNLDFQRLLILYYCFSKMMVTGEFDPNAPWGEDDDGEQGFKGQEFNED